MMSFKVRFKKRRLPYYLPLRKKRDMILNNVRLKEALARKKGKLLGRPPVEVTEEFIIAYKEWKSGTITAVDAMKKYAIKRSSFYKLVKQYEVARKGKSND